MERKDKRIFLHAPLTNDPAGQAPGSSLRLRGDDHHHISHVLRLRPGARLSLVDGTGFCYEATLEAVGGRDSTLRLDLRRSLPRPAPPRLILIHGLARGGRSELVLQKATELGIDVLAPAICARSVARPRDAEGKRNRWLEVLRQAARQCQRGYLPELLAPLPFADALRIHAEADLKLIAAFGGQGLRSFTPRLESANNVALVVGPEGGLDDAELDLADSLGYQRVSLGPLVLRSETAALALTALVAYAVGRLDATSDSDGDAPRS